MVEIGESRQKILLTHTRPNFGGLRWWFHCPRCKRRVTSLHKPVDASAYLCRHCFDLAYESTQLSGTKRWKAFQACGKSLGVPTREAARRIRLEYAPQELHEVKRPTMEKVQDRRTGFALSLTQQARKLGLSL